MIVRRESLAAYPDQLQLESPFGNFRPAISKSAEAPPCDVLWIAVKATQLETSLQAIPQPDTVGAMVPLLNGLDHLTILRAKYGAQEVIPATVAVETERVAPAHIVHRSPFARLNVLSAGRSRLAASIEQLQNLGFECRFIDDEPTLMWSKLVFLAPFALSTTAAGQAIGGVLSNPEWRELAIGCVREACAVAQAEGAKVNAEFVIAGSGKFPPSMRSSMQKDVEQGNPPELDAIAGPIIHGAIYHGIPHPATEKLVALIQAKLQMG